MTQSITAYPLCWPASFPRCTDRQWARFKTDMVAARTHLQDELDRLGATDPVLSSNLQLRLDGWPKADAKRPADPGVALYFTLKGQQMCMPCDRYSEAKDNIRALGLTIAAMRGIERWGGGHIMEATFTGFLALPAPENAHHWTDVLGVPLEATASQIQAAWKTQIKAAGGAESPDAAFINVARDRALKEITNG